MKLHFMKKEDTAEQIERDRLPRHIAIILDGNGRWAQRRRLPRSAGHRAGAETFRTIAAFCRDIGIEYLTVYAFSTENWKRPKDEVDAIMSLLKRYILEAIGVMERDNVRIRVLGDMEPLSDELRDLIRRCNAISEGLTGCVCSLCINYGGRAELVRAAKNFAKDCVCGDVKIEDLTEETFESYLWSAGMPSPELLIRPGGEQRLSNFLLWQCAYSEFYFTDVLWPDFTKRDLMRAIAAYQRRDRRFGGI